MLHKLIAVPDSHGYWKVCKVNPDGSVGDAIMTAIDEWRAKQWAAFHNQKKD